MMRRQRPCMLAAAVSTAMSSFFFGNNAVACSHAAPGRSRPANPRYRQASYQVPGTKGRSGDSNHDTGRVRAGAAVATEVSHALTLQGAQQVLAILRGVKLIENRSWKIPLGWYAIHAGSQPINEERGARTRAAWPDAPPEESLPHSAILGLFRVQAHTRPEKCRHGYIWARGPVCNLISEALELPRPVRCRGGRGLWRLSPPVLQRIREQVEECGVKRFDLSQALPVM